LFRQDKIIAVIVTLKLYGDESADETKQRVFAVAGVIGQESEWAETIRHWLRRTKGLPFHANVCESEFADHPDRQKHKDNLRLYKDLTTILADSRLIGVGVAMDLISQRACLPGVLPDMAYYKCFNDVIATISKVADGFNSHREREHTLKLEFVFDSRKESDGTAGTLYTLFRTLPEWADVSMFDTGVRFEGGQEPRLEMADLLARESMKELDRKVTNSPRTPRLSYQALDSAIRNDRKKFGFYELDRAYCERWRDEINKPNWLEAVDEYRDWLIRTGRVQHGKAKDTMINRSQFFTWREQRQAFKTRVRPSDGEA
jgi:hypothetical protein